MTKNSYTILSRTKSFLLDGKKLSISHRGLRLAIGLAEPVISITDCLERSWQIGLGLVSIFMLITSFTGVCLAGKLSEVIKPMLIREDKSQAADLSACCIEKD